MQTRKDETSAQEQLTLLAQRAAALRRVSLDVEAVVAQCARGLFAGGIPATYLNALSDSMAPALYDLRGRADACILASGRHLASPSLAPAEAPPPPDAALDFARDVAAAATDEAAAAAADDDDDVTMSEVSELISDALDADADGIFDDLLDPESVESLLEPHALLPRSARVLGGGGPFASFGSSCSSHGESAESAALTERFVRGAGSSSVASEDTATSLRSCSAHTLAPTVSSTHTPSNACTLASASPDMASAPLPPHFSPVSAFEAAAKAYVAASRNAVEADGRVGKWDEARDDLRALLSSLHTVMPAETGWEPVGLADLSSAASVKKAYAAALKVVHPDNLPPAGHATGHKVFTTLKSAWRSYRKGATMS